MPIMTNATTPTSSPSQPPPNPPAGDFPVAHPNTPSYRWRALNRREVMKGRNSLSWLDRRFPDFDPGGSQLKCLSSAKFTQDSRSSTRPRSRQASRCQRQPPITPLAHLLATQTQAGSTRRHSAGVFPSPWARQRASPVISQRREAGYDGQGGLPLAETGAD